jgi:hypothetical protein
MKIRSKYWKMKGNPTKLKLRISMSICSMLRPTTQNCSSLMKPSNNKSHLLI